jgi:hypothetical protein
MRIILIIPVLIFLFGTNLIAQVDFKRLDTRSFELYRKGDVKNLRIVADSLLSNGIDYYYLRMRLGISEYNRQSYNRAVLNLSNALKFNTGDTVARELIYNSYLYSGRKGDAGLYLRSLSDENKNYGLRSADRDLSLEFFLESSAAGYDVYLYKSDSLNYDAVKSNFSFTAGVNADFLKIFTGTFSFTNFSKTGTKYSALYTTGMDLNFNQSQFYLKLTGNFFDSWQFTGFGNFVTYTDNDIVGVGARRYYLSQRVNEYNVGFGVVKNMWRMRAMANVSFSNFGNSNQTRGEGYLMLLPRGNLNLYFTSVLRGQTDINWGNTYQASQEIGFRINKYVWLESGITKGNSFLYTASQGAIVNNSFQIPVTTLYSNIIVLPKGNFKFTITPYYLKNEIYSWNLTDYTRINKVSVNSFGISVKILYKFR